jgi:AraC-like DNA-binding protein
LSIVAFLPPQLLSHVRHVFAREPEFFVAQSWKDLEAIIRREPITVAIVDPATDGAVDVDAVASLLQRYPSLPVVGYVMLSPTAFGAIAQLSRRGLSHVVLHRFGDSRERLQQMVRRVRSNPPLHEMTERLAPVLRNVPLNLARAVTDMFDRPHRYNSVLDLATGADLSPVSVYRYLDHAGLVSPKKLLIAARLARGVIYLKDPGYAVSEVAIKLGYRHPRIFTAHVIDVFRMTPSRLRARLTTEDAMAHLARWLDIPEESVIPKRPGPLSTGL